MINIVRYMVLLILLNIAQAPATIKVRLMSAECKEIILTDEELSIIGLGPTYNRELFKKIVKKHLIAEHQEYDWRRSRTIDEILPAELLDETETEVTWIKTQLYCLAKHVEQAEDDLYNLVFPQIGLTLVVDDNEEFLRQTLGSKEVQFESDMAELYARGLKIHEAYIPELGGGIQIKYAKVVLSQQSICFFDKIGAMLEGEEKYIDKIHQFCTAMKLAGITKKIPKLHMVPTNEDKIIAYLESVGLLATPKLTPLGGS